MESSLFNALFYLVWEADELAGRVRELVEELRLQVFSGAETGTAGQIQGWLYQTFCVCLDNTVYIIYYSWC